MSTSREQGAGGSRLRHPAELPFHVSSLLLLVPALVVIREASHPFTVRRLERLYRLGLLHARVREAEPETTV